MPLIHDACLSCGIFSILQQALHDFLGFIVFFKNSITFLYHFLFLWSFLSFPDFFLAAPRCFYYSNYSLISYHCVLLARTFNVLARKVLYFRIHRNKRKWIFLFRCKMLYIFIFFLVKSTTYFIVLVSQFPQIERA